MQVTQGGLSFADPCFVPSGQRQTVPFRLQAKCGTADQAALVTEHDKDTKAASTQEQSSN